MSDAAAGPLTPQRLRQVVEGALLVSAQPLSVATLARLFADAEPPPSEAAVREALEALAADCAGRAVALVELAGGFRYQLRVEISPWIQRLLQEPPPRYSRALLETLALVAYRQPLSRGDIEQVRGVSVSGNIIRTLEEREWIRVVGAREAPGRAALYGTTQRFLQDFGLSGLDALPSLPSTEQVLGVLVDAGSVPPETAGLSSAAAAPDDAIASAAGRLLNAAGERDDGR